MIAKLAIARKPAFLLVSIAALAALIAVSLVYTNRSEAQEKLRHVMPPMTLTYEVDGRPIRVGNRSVGGFREVRRLEYTSKTQWTETVIEAPTIDLGRYGTGSTVGSYSSLNGDVRIEYDALTDTMNQDVRDGGILVPNPAFAYAMIPPDMMDARPGFTRSQVVTETDVCEKGECAESVIGIRYLGSRVELVMYKTDEWFIPLRFGDFEVQKIEIH
jgi:hypothetical protein